MVFASCNAIATGSSGVSTFVAPGVISLILCVLVPLGAIKRFLSKKLVKYGQHPLPAQQAVYIKDQKGWRDVKENQSYQSWRKSTFVAGYGLLFRSYKGMGQLAPHLDGHANGDMLVDDTDDTCAGKDSGYYHHGFILHVLCFRTL